MKLRKAIKKIAAIGTGATMVGATLFGAAAVDLAQYPSPLFIKDGQFDGIIVVGDAAASSDVIGAVDVATSLQFESKTEVAVDVSGSGATTFVSGDAAKLAKGSDPLNYGEMINDPITTLTDDDLESLSSGSISNQKGSFKYNQFIDISTGATTMFGIDDDQSDDPAMYLNFPDADTIYVYKATFQPALESDIDADKSNELDDIENKKITLLGQEYTILNTELTDGDLSMELLTGAIQDTLEEYTSKTYTLNGIDYEVEVIAIGSDDTVILKVNGEVTDKLEEDDTYTLADGTDIGIKTILENEGTEVGGGDIVEFYLGASKITLEESDWTTDNWATFDVGEDTVDAEINFKGSNTSDKILINDIQVRWVGTEEYFVPEGGKLSEQLDNDEKGNLFLQNIDYEFAGINVGPTELIELSPSGDNMRLKLTTKTDDEFSFDVFHIDGGDVALGEDGTNDKILVLDPATSLVKDNYFILSEDEYSKVMQVNKFQDSDDEVWFKNVATGEISKISAGSCNGVGTYDLILDGKTYSFSADCGAETVDFTDFGSDQDGSDETAVLYTKGGAKVIINATEGAAGTGRVYVYEEERDDFSHADYTDGFVVTVNQHGSETEELKVASLAAIDISGNQVLDTESWDSKDNYEESWTGYGTHIIYDTDEQGKISIMYPENEVTFDVYVSSGVTSTSVLEGSAGGSITSTEVTPITVGTAKLASEVSNVAGQNMIVVGGPCANAVAAQLMGNPSPCTKGFEEGKAIIKLYENGNKVAMLVAGATALDTRRAARVLADYTSFPLSGMEVEVAGTSTTFSDTKVSQVTHMEEEEMMGDEE
ncbi:S-layer protein [Candidatus Woesearchaeota archaeon]|nr:S-layer protein [Candidatus Woesearchaeota archaeon]